MIMINNLAEATKKYFDEMYNLEKSYEYWEENYEGPEIGRKMARRTLIVDREIVLERYNATATNILRGRW